MRNDLLTTFVGFEDLFDRVFNTKRDGEIKGTSVFDTNYPKYNIIKTDDGYTIDLALAGFSKDDLTVTVSNGILRVNGINETKEDVSTFLHRGISSRSFTRKFDLNADLDVKDVTFENGILSINLIKLEKEDSIKNIEIK